VAVAPGTLAGIPCHACNVASVASGVGGASLDLRHTGRARQGLYFEVVDLVVQMARENPRWGYVRIVGECRKLGVQVSAPSVRRILRRHRIKPAPRRGGPSWTAFLRAQAGGMVACDFLTVKTVGLTRLCAVRGAP
jgi:hypothetical protein